MPDGRSALADRPPYRARSAEADRRIRSLRRPREESLDFWQPQDVVVERERRLTSSGSRLETSATVFLTGAECGFTCVFCDLWQYTRTERTPVGAIPAQIESALEQLSGRSFDRLKLYNASNFFDARAVPVVDDAAILDVLEGCADVTVECHPRLVGERCYRFAEALHGRLEVALGVETVHPEAHAQLNKGCSLDQTWSAARALRDRGIAWRAFVLLGAPFLGAHEQVDWLRRSVDRVADEGAACVSLVPLRLGNGELERLASRGELHPLNSDAMEKAFEELVEDDRLVVQLDPWDLEQHLSCAPCRSGRIERIERMNRTGRRQPAVVCADCGTGEA
ncbi:MAG: radical SAM protein [Acidobacteriota bacterium]